MGMCSATTISTSASPTPTSLLPDNGCSCSVGVLASGRGSNFAALLRQQQDGYFANASISCLISNVSTAPAITVASDAGIPAYPVLPKSFASLIEYETEIIRLLDQHEVKWLILAGYMKIVGRTLLDRFPLRIINIHPSLLPAFPGLHGQKQALDYGVRFAGCTAHFVDAGVDTGPIIGQRVVPVLPGDTEDTLSARILGQEHQLFPEALKLVTERPWHVEGRQVIWDTTVPED